MGMGSSSSGRRTGAAELIEVLDITHIPVFILVSFKYWNECRFRPFLISKVKSLYVESIRAIIKAADVAAAILA